MPKLFYSCSQLPPFMHSSFSYINSQVQILESSLYLKPISNILVLPPMLLWIPILLPSYPSPHSQQERSYLLDAEHEIREGFIKEAVSEIDLDILDRICLSSKRRKDLPIGDNSIEFVYFQIKYYEGHYLCQTLLGTDWVRVWVLRTKTQTPSLATSWPYLGVGIRHNIINETVGVETNRLESKSPV